MVAIGPTGLRTYNSREVIEMLPMFFVSPESVLLQVVINWLTTNHVWPINDANLTGGLLTLITGAAAGGG
jgi:hypothetical protein